MLVNDALYYAGDSFAVPDGVSVDVLAAPAGAPWMKIAESMDYVMAVKPRRAFPTHEMVLSRAGKDLSNARLGWATEQGGGEYLPLEPGDSFDLLRLEHSAGADRRVCSISLRQLFNRSEDVRRIESCFDRSQPGFDHDGDDLFFATAEIAAQDGDHTSLFDLFESCFAAGNQF